LCLRTVAEKWSLAILILLSGEDSSRLQGTDDSAKEETMIELAEAITVVHQISDTPRKSSVISFAIWSEEH
jgi:hypothetical protein